MAIEFTNNVLTYEEHQTIMARAHKMRADALAASFRTLGRALRSLLSGTRGTTSASAH